MRDGETHGSAMRDAYTGRHLLAAKCDCSDSVGIQLVGCASGLSECKCFSQSICTVAALNACVQATLCFALRRQTDEGDATAMRPMGRRHIGQRVDLARRGLVELALAMSVRPPDQAHDGSNRT